MESWDEVRTAYHVARVGTVSGAAEVLGVHHATVIRHIDALEHVLGVKLFQRHARGYTPTEAGNDLLRVAGATDDQFSQLLGRLKGRGDGVSGELVVTSLSALTPELIPILADFRNEHPEVVLRYLTSDRVFRMEYGEAHVAIRAGKAPEEPDNVVQPFRKLGMRLVAAQSYVQRFGLPASVDDFKDHSFVGADSGATRAPFYLWLKQVVSHENIAFRVTDSRAMPDAVVNGAGIGFVPDTFNLEENDLVEVHEPLDEWQTPLWIVTHVDLHRTSKVQTFLTFLKERIRGVTT